MKNVIIAIITVATFIVSVMVGLNQMGNADMAVGVALMVAGVVATVAIIASAKVSEVVTA
jgi:hypothetical protein